MTSQAGGARHRRRFVRRAVGSVARVATYLALAVACIAVAGSVVAGMLGFKTMIVTSGSMEPSFGAGDALLLQPTHSSAIRAGDVITFHPLAGHRRLTTHRVITRRSVGGQVHLQTKGDANEDPDANLVPAGHVVGRVALVLPWIGRLLLFSATRAGRLVLIGGPALWLMVQQVIVLVREGRGRDPAPQSA